MKDKHKAIKRYERNPEKFDVIDFFDTIGRRRQLKLGDENDKSAFVDIVNDSLASNSYDTMIYGKRVEAMFSYVVASLGRCVLVKKEDGGDVFAEDPTIEIPDYKVVLADNSQMLIEVKNHHPQNVFAEYSMDTEYIRGLSKYANVMNTDLKIAVYWSKMSLWTLLSANDFEVKGRKSTISMGKAMKRNQMSVLGDVFIGTTTPLAIRYYADKTQKNYIDIDVKGSDNRFTAEITLGEVEILCSGNVITNSNEQRIASALMAFGYLEEKCVVEMLDDTSQVEYLECSYNPIEDNDNPDNCCIVGVLSTIISRQYGQLTAPNGKVERLSPDIDPGLLGFIIPDDYQSADLPLWRFHMEANFDDEF